jgi:hypothetical protein
LVVIDAGYAGLWCRTTQDFENDSDSEEKRLAPQRFSPVCEALLPRRRGDRHAS